MLLYGMDLHMTIHQVQIQVDQLLKYTTFIHISCSIQQPGSRYKFLAPLSKGKQSALRKKRSQNGSSEAPYLSAEQTLLWHYFCKKEPFCPLRHLFGSTFFLSVYKISCSTKLLLLNEYCLAIVIDPLLYSDTQTICHFMKGLAHMTRGNLILSEFMEQNNYRVSHNFTPGEAALIGCQISLIFLLSKSQVTFICFYPNQMYTCESKIRCCMIPIVDSGIVPLEFGFRMWSGIRFRQGLGVFLMLSPFVLKSYLLLCSLLFLEVWVPWYTPPLRLRAGAYHFSKVV